jgi:hypothetical protein
MRLRLFAALAVLGVALAGVSVASAASVSVRPGDLTVRTAGACTTQTVTVTRTEPQYFTIWGVRLWQDGWRGVRLSDVPTACRSTPLRVTADDGPADATVTAGATGSTIDITLDAEYRLNVSTFDLTIGGWHVPTSL